MPGKSADRFSHPLGRGFRSAGTDYPSVPSQNAFRKLVMHIFQVAVEITLFILGGAASTEGMEGITQSWIVRMVPVYQRVV